jgi:hypothetical protein
VRRLVLLRSLPGVCPSGCNVWNRSHLLDAVHLFALVLLPKDVYCDHAHDVPAVDLSDVSLAALEEEGALWVVAGPANGSTGLREVGW